MKIAIGIVAHEKREKQALDLFETVRANAMNIDDGTLGCNGNHVVVLRELRDEQHDADWYVILEDDAQPVEDFNRQVPLALKAAPTPLVSFYLGTSNPVHWQNAIQRAISCAEAWIVATHMIHGVAYAVRADVMDELMAHLDPASPRPIDEQISQWSYPERKLVGYTCPSLVDHEDGEPVITVRMDGAPRDNPRKAWKVGTRANWHTKVVLL